MRLVRSRPRLARRVSRVRLAHTCVVASLATVGLLSAVALPIHADWESLAYPACVGFVALCAWLIWSWRAVTSRFFEPYVLFLSAAIVFNGGQAFLEVLHLNVNGLLDSRFSAETTVKALFLVMLGLASLHLGALLSIRMNRTVPPNMDRMSDVPKAEDIRRIAWLLLLVSAIPAAFALGQAISVVMSSGYFALYQQEARTGLAASDSILASLLVPATFFLLAGSSGRPSLRFVSMLIIVAYSLAQFFVGSRAKAVMPLLAYLWLWHSQVRPIRPSVLVGIGAAMLGVLFPLVGTVRNISGGERLSLGFLFEIFLSIENPVIASIAEMGGTMSTVAYTLDLVPAVREFDMGAGYLYALMTIIPSVFWDLHPTVARGFASHWLVWTVAPAFAAAGGGLGYSFIAEAYLNFGWYGTPLLLSALGYSFTRFTHWGYKVNDPAKMATVAALLSFFLFYARAESASAVRPLVWYSTVPYLCILMASAIRRKCGRRARSYIIRRRP